MKNGNQQGFTLTELIITLVALAVLLVILIPILKGVLTGADPMIRHQAAAFAQSLMDEVLSKRWDENSPVGGGPICSGESPSQATRPSLVDDCAIPGARTASPLLGPDAGETARSQFDDLDDYHGYQEPDGSGKFYDQAGTPLDGFAGYTRQVSVRYIPSIVTAIRHDTPAAPATSDTKLVVVEVTTPRGETLRLVAAVCNL